MRRDPARSEVTRCEQRTPRKKRTRLANRLPVREVDRDDNEVSSSCRTTMALWRLLVVSFLQVVFGLRRLEDNADFEYNLADFTLRFEKCQFVKMFDDALAQDQDADSPLALKHFVVFKLCDSCESCNVYGSYVLEVDEYLEYTIENQREGLETMCQTCNQQCNDENVNDDESCGDCVQLCNQYENLEANGLIDAADYTTCQLWQPVEGNADGQPYYYVGPRCNSGNSIDIGVFSDQNCWEPVDDVDIEDLLGAKLSYHLLRHTSSSTDKVCLACAEGAYAADADQDAADGDNVNEMCENLYDGAAKCESKTGLENGFVQVNQAEQEYENQVENEFMACTFINSLVWNSYTETGEINWKAKQDAIIRTVTHKQVAVLALLVVVFGSLFGLMYYYNRKINQIETSPPLLDPKSGSFT
jgi:hypothetical protein